MTHFCNWVAQLRRSLASRGQPTGIREGTNRHFAGWEPALHQQQAIDLLARAANEPGSAVFFFDFSGIKTVIHRGSSDQVRKSYEVIKRIFEISVGAEGTVFRYDDLSHFVFFAGGGHTRGGEVCRMIWSQVVRELGLDAAASKGLRLYLVDVPPAKAAVVDSDLFGTPSLRFLRLIPDVPRSDVEEMPEELGNIGFVYRPLMEVATNLISLFVCIPTRRIERNHFRYGYGVLDNEGHPPAIRCLDHRVLDAVAATFSQAGKKKGQDSLVVIPVHFETLSHPMSRITYAFACSQRLANHADGVVFEVIGLPERTPTERIVNAVSPLILHSHGIFARVPLDREDLHNYHYSGICAVGVDAYPLNQDQEQLAFQMSDFVERANAQSLKTYVHGVRSLSLSTFVSCSGFDCVGGHALTNAIKAPRAPYLYKLLFKYIAMA